MVLCIFIIFEKVMIMETYKIIPYPQYIENMQNIAAGHLDINNYFDENMTYVLSGRYGTSKLFGPAEGDQTKAFTLQGELTQAGFMMLGEMTGTSKSNEPFQSVYMTDIDGQPLATKKGFNKGVGVNI